MKKKKENLVPMQGRLDGFFKKSAPMENGGSGVAPGSSSKTSPQVGKSARAHNAEMVDIEDLLTMKKRKKSPSLPDDGKVKRKLRLVNIKNYFSKQAPENSGSNILREINRTSRPDSSRGDLQKCEGKIIKVVDLTNDSEVGTIMISAMDADDSEDVIEIADSVVCEKESKDELLIEKQTEVKLESDGRKSEVSMNDCLENSHETFKSLTVESNAGQENTADVSVADIFDDSDMDMDFGEGDSIISKATAEAHSRTESDNKRSPASSESQADSAIDVNSLPTISEDAALEHEMLNLKSQELRDVNSLLGNEMASLVDDWEMEQESQQQLDLSCWQRCKVVEVRSEGRSKVLNLLSPSSGAVAECVLKGVWTHFSIEPGLVVSIVARRLDERWTVDNEEGFVILYPDMLVSGTAVVGSLFCQRKGVLSDWFRGIDAGNKVMVLGSLIHELLQEVLKRKLYDTRDIRSLVEQMIQSQHGVKDLYSVSMSTAEAREELLSVVPSIQDFISVHIKSNGRRAKPPNWQGRICSIMSVEENYWISQLGLKGKVDVSVEVQELGSSQKKMMPLELKTGRASNSIEHRGQVILYNLMAAETCPGVDAGLLLYLRENSITKIQVGRNEKRDIMCRRNELAEYLTIPNDVPDSSAECAPPRLPEPINNARACSKCPYLDLCSAFLTRSGMDKLSSSHAMRQLAPEATSHLTASHIDYLILWTALVQLEEATRRAKSSLLDLWSKTPSQREERGKCLAGLVLQPPVMSVGPGCCLHTFQRAGPPRDMRSAGFSEGEMVLASTDKRLCLALGTILDVGEDVLTVDFPRDLSESGELFHIDAYEPQGQMSTTLTPLGALFENSQRMTKLRNLIIDRQIPMFDKARARVLAQGHDFLNGLNPSQQQAVLQVLAAHDYLLIKGRPGAGKTTLVAALVRLLVAEGRSVLLTSHTHSAVDNVLLKLVGTEVEFLRLGSTTRVHDEIHPWAEDVLTAGCTTPELLDAVYHSKPVVATTCHGANHFLFTRRKFDVCIVDESTQVLQPLVLCPLFHAEKFILVGDPEQLPPVVVSRKAGQLGLSESLFVRLDRPEATVSLDEQYRMNRTITALANALTYGGSLKCANSAVADATVELSVTEDLLGGKGWINKAVSKRMEDAVVFLDTSGCSAYSAQDANESEADIVKELLEVFLQAGVEAGRMGVIAPYRAQVALLRKTAGSVEVNTVDQYQGRDKEIIVFSCTRSWNTREEKSRQPQETEILNDKRRLTVAITRAKHKLILIGDLETLRLYSSFRKLIDSLSPDNIVTLKDHR